MLKKNPNYHGSRPHNLNEIDFTQLSIDRNQGILETKNGQLDYCPDCPTADQSFSLNSQYGTGSPAAQAGKQRFFISPQIEVDYYAINTARPAFSNPLVRAGGQLRHRPHRHGQAARLQEGRSDGQVPAATAARGIGESSKSTRCRPISPRPRP